MVYSLSREFNSGFLQEQKSIKRGVFEPDPEIRCESTSFDSVLPSPLQSPTTKENSLWPFSTNRPSFSVFKGSNGVAPTPTNGSARGAEIPDANDYEQQQRIRAQRARQELEQAQREAEEREYQYVNHQ